jgi:Kinetochore complex Fta4 of Sim4 subunit, or CENP-50
VITVSILL